jgi:hypothetical protein
MVVHFITSKASIASDTEYIRKIVEVIHDLGHELARDWVRAELDFVKTGKKHDSIDWRVVNEENLEALSKADVVIAEATARSFSTGFQVANAIQQKKPVLILSRDNALVGSFSSGISSNFVHSESYTKDNVQDIIADFINENTFDNKDMRFNFFIDRQIYNYLRWASYKTGKNKSEILRELVLREIEKKED